MFQCICCSFESAEKSIHVCLKDDTLNCSEDNMMSEIDYSIYIPETH